MGKGRSRLVGDTASFEQPAYRCPNVALASPSPQDCNGVSSLASLFQILDSRQMSFKDGVKTKK